MGNCRRNGSAYNPTNDERTFGEPFFVCSVQFGVFCCRGAVGERAEWVRKVTCIVLRGNRHGEQFLCLTA